MAEGRLSCLDRDTLVHQCQPGDICITQWLSAANTITTAPTAVGCMPADRLPPPIVGRLLGSPLDTCALLRRTNYCNIDSVPPDAMIGDFDTSNSYCCYCFTSECNRNTVNASGVRWTDGGGFIQPDASTTCRELRDMQQYALGVVGNEIGVLAAAMRSHGTATTANNHAVYTVLIGVQSSLLIVVLLRMRR